MPASKRRWGREMALQMLYQKELGASDAGEVKASFDPFEYLAARDDGEAVAVAPDLVRQALAFAGELFDGTLARRDEIDELVKSQAENWRLERMPAVDRNILRLAVYELLAEPDVPPLVVLDEAIELAKRYGSEQSGAFVNGLLDGLLRRPEIARG
ncbi:MAG: transcription antitermination factor NusB [Acidobacteriota bacterium]|nr:transcription antitermination factor NusB [Acidobacteriota bacterium]MDH3522820.1 transcription antitermination factor NusB [Acidobacteriota bacterium]